MATMKERMEYTIPPMDWNKRDLLTDWIEDHLREREGRLAHIEAKMDEEGILTNRYLGRYDILEVISWKVNPEKGIPAGRKISCNPAIAEQLISAGVINRKNVMLEK